MKRFYLYKTAYLYKPRTMMLSSLILAFKVEEIVFDTMQFLSKFKGAEPEKVFEYETSLLDGLKFELLVYSPLDSLDGLKLLLEIPSEIIKPVEEIIYRSYLTDAILLYPPGLIAAAAICCVNKEIVLKKQEILNLSSEKIKKIEECCELIKNVKIPAETEASAIKARIASFEKTFPEFFKYMEDMKKKRHGGAVAEGKRKKSDAEKILDPNIAVGIKKAKEEKSSTEIIAKK